MQLGRGSTRPHRPASCEVERTCRVGTVRYAQEEVRELEAIRVREELRRACALIRHGGLVFDGLACDEEALRHCIVTAHHEVEMYPSARCDSRPVQALESSTLCAKRKEGHASVRVSISSYEPTHGANRTCCPS